MSEIVYMLRFIHDISFNDPFTKIQLWLPIKQEIYDLDEDYQN